MVNHYELLYLVPATYSDEELAPIKEKVRSLIQKNGGVVGIEDSLGKRKLAYPIKKIRQGHYLLFELDLEGENLKKLGTDLHLTTDILRHQIVKKKPGKPMTPFKPRLPVLERERKPEATKGIKVEEKDKVSLEDLDKKLDEILEGDIL